MENESLSSKWEKLLAVRQKVNVAIEEESNKIIGSSLEADVDYFA